MNTIQTIIVVIVIFVTVKKEQPSGPTSLFICLLLLLYLLVIILLEVWWFSLGKCLSCGKKNRRKEKKREGRSMLESKSHIESKMPLRLSEQKHSMEELNNVTWLKWRKPCVTQWSATQKHQWAEDAISWVALTAYIQI